MARLSGCWVTRRPCTCVHGLRSEHVCKEKGKWKMWHEGVLFSLFVCFIKQRNQKLFLIIPLFFKYCYNKETQNNNYNCLHEKAWKKLKFKRKKKIPFTSTARRYSPLTITPEKKKWNCSFVVVPRKEMPVFLKTVSCTFVNDAEQITNMLGVHVPNM